VNDLFQICRCTSNHVCVAVNYDGSNGTAGIIRPTFRSTFLWIFLSGFSVGLAGQSSELAATINPKGRAGIGQVVFISAVPATVYHHNNDVIQCCSFMSCIVSFPLLIMPHSLLWLYAPFRLQTGRLFYLYVGLHYAGEVMTVYRDTAANDNVLTADQLKRLARHRYSVEGHSLLDPYMQVRLVLSWKINLAIMLFAVHFLIVLYN